MCCIRVYKLLLQIATFSWHYCCQFKWKTSTRATILFLLCSYTFFLVLTHQMFLLLSSDPKNINTTTTLQFLWKTCRQEILKGLYINVDSFKLISNSTQPKLILIILLTMRNSTPTTQPQYKLLSCSVVL